MFPLVVIMQQQDRSHLVDSFEQNFVVKLINTTPDHCSCVCKIRRPLFDESGHTFFLVVSSECHLEETLLIS